MEQMVLLEGDDGLLSLDDTSGEVVVLGVDSERGWNSGEQRFSF